MFPPKTPIQAAPEDAHTAEARMRRALGLDGASPAQPAQQRPEQARARHRFVQDGEVPVVVVNGRTPERADRAPDAPPNGRAAAVQVALDKERAARATAERSLAEALATVQSLRTKLAHAELAHGEALAAERSARERAEAALREALAPRQAAEQTPGEAAPARTPEAPAPRVKAKRAASVKPPSRAPAAKVREQKPVKWWLPSYKAKTKAD